MFLGVTNDQQAQQSGLGFFANAQNPVVTGGTFIVVSLYCSCICDFSTNSLYRMMSIFSLLDLVEHRQTSL